MQCQVNGKSMEQVKEIKYFGIMISSDGCMGGEVEQRMASKTIGAVESTVLGRKELTKGIN